MSVPGNDTIVARATARGAAALAVVRLSGPRAIAMAAARFRPTDLEKAASHSVHVGWITTSDGKDIDQVVATLFRSPTSITGEDVVEISCHGGDLSSGLILECLMEGGAKPAQPGEFTRRAFLNGKMDLAQAEAVAELIHAGSLRAHDVSLAHLKGGYSELLSSLREDILDLTAFLELELDFSEEDVAFADRERLEVLVQKSTDILHRLLGSYRYGAVVRDGLRIVIGGRPNAGKSTLLNAIVGHDRSIVSEIPGTTRDEIEAEAVYDGLRLRLIDTAGLRETDHEVESEGVRRAESAIRGADAVIYVYDVTSGLDPEEKAYLDRLEKEKPGVPVFTVANKADLLAGMNEKPEYKPISGRRPGPPASKRTTHLSALRAQSDETLLEPLLEQIVDALRSDHTKVEESSIVTNERHRYHLLRAQEAIRRVEESLLQNVFGDMLIADLRVAMNEIGSITGAVTNEDILSRIFSRFCIGK